MWGLLSAIFAILSITTLASDRAATAALLACAILSGWMARDALHYNSADFPRLLEYWHRSLMCNRCGEVFVPA